MALTTDQAVKEILWSKEYMQDQGKVMTYKNREKFKKDKFSLNYKHKLLKKYGFKIVCHTLWS